MSLGRWFRKYIMRFLPSNILGLRRSPDWVGAASYLQAGKYYLVMLAKLPVDNSVFAKHGDKEPVVKEQSGSRYTGEQDACAFNWYRYLLLSQ